MYTLAQIHERKNSQDALDRTLSNLFFFNFKVLQQLFLTEVNLEQVNLLSFFYFSNKDIIIKTNLIKLPFMKLLKNTFF